MNNNPNVILFTSKCPPEETPDSLTVPIGLFSLRFALNNNGIKCDVIDHQLNTEAEYIGNIKKGLYDVIGISVTHWRMAEDVAFLHTLKKKYRSTKKRCLFVAGGVQATINYKQWLECGFDLVCLGMAEDTLLEVCKRFINSSAPIYEMFSGLNGVAFLDRNGNVEHMVAQPLTMENFEQIMYKNFISMELPYYDYWNFLKKRATGLLYANNRSFIFENGRLLTASQCLAKCGFCCSPNFLRSAQGKTAKPAILSAEQVLNLMLHTISTYGAKSFSINDEDFLVGSKYGIERAFEMCELIQDAKKKNKMPEGIRFSCQTRARCFLEKNSDGSKRVNYPLMQALSKAGFHNVSIGAETFSDRLLKCPSINKGVTSKELNTVLHGMVENNLYTTINLILGIPESTKVELLDTIRQVLEYSDKPCQISIAHRMLSFPGSPLYGSDAYPTVDAIIENPENNKKISIRQYFKLHNEEMGSIINQVERTILENVAIYKQEHGLEKEAVLPRIIKSLLIFRSIAKLADDKDLFNNVSNKIEQFSAVCYS